MPTDDDFESFRRSRADLDPAAERRIRARFEELRQGAPDVADATPVATVEPIDDSPSARHRRRSGRVLVAAALVAVLALVVIARIVGDDDRAQVAAGFDDVPLTDLATRAANRPDQGLPPGTVLYVEELQGQRLPASGDLSPTLLTTDARRWAYPDGTGLERTTAEATAEGPGQVPEVPSGVQEARITEPGTFLNVMPYDELRALPTTPDGLLDAARSVIPDQNPASTAEWLVRVLALDVTPPAVRSAAFLALRSIGAQPMGRVTDDHGRTGIAFGDVAVAPSWIVVIDPSTTTIQSFGRDIGSPDAPVRGASRWTEYLQQRVETNLPS